MRAQCVEVRPVCFERRVEPDALERLGWHLEPLVAVPVFLGQIARLIEEAEVRPFDVEADRGDTTLVRWKVREDRREQELDGAGLRREPRDARDVEMRGFGAKQEVGVEVDGRVAAGGGVEPDGNGRGRR